MRHFLYISNSLAFISLFLLSLSCKPKTVSAANALETADSNAMLHSDGDGDVFEWCGVYTLTNQNENTMRELGLDNPEFDWGLWGHNLKKAVGMNKDFAATVNGKKNEDQYCFSSAKLYKALYDYILNEFGKGSEALFSRITIMPNDNKLVCQCEECREAGNTETNATPAVSKFISRLASDFPHHIFFTSAYLTTKDAPTEKLPENVGVFISAIDIQMRVQFKEKKGFAEFDALYDQWKQKTDRIYIWEYIRNFDDYLTPYPCLEPLRARLLYYKEKGVKGIFMNGSGYDYSTFDDLQTYVISRLVKNPEAEVEPLVNEFLKKNYPQTAEIISDYYLALEDKVKKSNNYLPFYGDISEAKEYYFQTGKFEEFRSKLEKASKKINGPERKRLNELLTALNFTRMEIIRTKDGKTEQQTIEDAIEVMKGAKEIPSMKNYKETNGSIEEYIKNFQKKKK